MAIPSSTSTDEERPAEPGPRRIDRCNVDEADVVLRQERREGELAPRPVLEGKDRLFCFGNLEEMRSMISDRK